MCRLDILFLLVSVSPKTDKFVFLVRFALQEDSFNKERRSFKRGIQLSLQVLFEIVLGHFGEQFQGNVRV